MLLEFANDLAARYWAALTTRSAMLLVTTLPVFLVLAVAWEYFRLARDERTVRRAFANAFPAEDFRAVTFRTDVFCTFAAHLVKRPLVGFLLKLVFAVAAADVAVSYLNRTFGVPEVQLSWLPGIIALQTLALYLSDEFSIYVVHVLQHKVPILWASHRTHHSAEALTPLTAASRQTILPLPTDYVAILGIDFVVKAVVLGAVLYWTTPTIHPFALTLMGYILFYVYLNEWFSHSRLRISYGPLNRIIVAPVLHQIHHSAELHHRDKNFGRSLSLFDWIFGTLYVPGRHETWRLGIDATELGAGNPHVRIRDYLFEPWRYAWASLRRRPAAARRRADARGSESSELARS